MRTLLITLALCFITAAQLRAQSAAILETRFKNEVPTKEDTLAFRFKGKQLLVSLFDYARIYKDKTAYPPEVRNQAYESAKKIFGDKPEFYIPEKNKPLKVNFEAFMEKLSAYDLNFKTNVTEKDAQKDTNGIGLVEAASSGFTIHATIGLIKIKKKFGSQEEEVWEAVLSSASLKE